MEEKMVTMMAMGSAEKFRYPISDGPITDSSSASPTWKLYDNPHYSAQHHHHHHSLRNKHHHPYTCLSKSSRSSYHTRDLSAFARPMDRGDVVNLSDLDNALAEIKDLRAELEFERRMRRKVEALNRALGRELEEERRGREEACRRLAEEIAGAREEAERAMKEVEDERRMVRMAEVMREERVQMKLSEAKFVMEEKIKEMMPVEEGNIKTAAAKVKTARSTSEEFHSSDGVQKKEVENPHIKRGIKGMEFPRAVRGRPTGMGSSPSSREGRGGGQQHLGSNLECQRAQLRVLMRHKNPAGSGGIIGVAENLVM